MATAAQPENLITNKWGQINISVVGHQDVRVDRASLARGGLAEALKVEAPIGVCIEARGAVVASLNDVQRNAREL